MACTPRAPAGARLSITGFAIMISARAVLLPAIAAALLFISSESITAAEAGQSEPQRGHLPAGQDLVCPRNGGRPHGAGANGVRYGIWWGEGLSRRAARSRHRSPPDEGM